MDLLGAYSNQRQTHDRLQAVLDRPTSAQVPVKKAVRRQVRLSSDDQLKLVEQYKAVRSVFVVADLFGINRKTAAEILERHGIERRYNVLSAAEIAAAGRLYEAGQSYASIAGRFGADPSTIRTALLRAGFASRPVGTNQWR